MAQSSRPEAGRRRPLARADTRTNQPAAPRSRGKSARLPSYDRSRDTCREWLASPSDTPRNSHLHETKYRPPALAATNSSGLFGSVAAGIRGVAEAGAQRIPFVGAPELEGFAHGHLAH